ncbi:MAG: hypothetical protein WCT54_04425 [Patescibacteria group bacterium]
MNRKNVSLVLAGGMSVSLVFLGLGCNPFQKAQDAISQKIGESVAENVISQATGGKVDINNDGNQIAFKDDKTGATSAFGEDVKLPNDFPKEVLIYPGVKISGLTTSHENGESAWLMASSDDDMSKVVDWYDGQTKDGGWTKDSSLTIEKMETRVYSKDKDQLSITDAPTDDESKGKTTLIVSWSREVPQADDSSTTETE